MLLNSLTPKEKTNMMIIMRTDATPEQIAAVVKRVEMVLREFYL